MTGLNRRAYSGRHKEIVEIEAQRYTIAKDTKRGMSDRAAICRDALYFLAIFLVLVFSAAVAGPA
jgi:hypothetical protein